MSIKRNHDSKSAQYEDVDAKCINDALKEMKQKSKKSKKSSKCLSVVKKAVSSLLSKASCVNPDDLSSMHDPTDEVPPVSSSMMPPISSSILPPAPSQTTPPASSYSAKPPPSLPATPQVVPNPSQLPAEIDMRKITKQALRVCRDNGHVYRIDADKLYRKKRPSDDQSLAALAQPGTSANLHRNDNRPQYVRVVPVHDILPSDETEIDDATSNVLSSVKSSRVSYKKSKSSKHSKKGPFVPNLSLIAENSFASENTQVLAEDVCNFYEIVRNRNNGLLELTLKKANTKIRLIERYGVYSFQLENLRVNIDDLKEDIIDEEDECIKYRNYRFEFSSVEHAQRFYNTMVQLGKPKDPFRDYSLNEKSSAFCSIYKRNDENRWSNKRLVDAKRVETFGKVSILSRQENYFVMIAIEKTWQDQEFFENILELQFSLIQSDKYNEKYILITVADGDEIRLELLDNEVVDFYQSLQFAQNLARDNLQKLNAKIKSQSRNKTSKPTAGDVAREGSSIKSSRSRDARDSHSRQQQQQVVTSNSNAAPVAREGSIKSNRNRDSQQQQQQAALVDSPNTQSASVEKFMDELRHRKAQANQEKIEKRKKRCW